MKRSAWRYLWKSEDIRKKLLITLLLLAIFRFLANIPVPGINRTAVELLSQPGGVTGGNESLGGLVNLLDLLSGGAVSQFSILAMGVYPYITAQIILQLLQPIIPALERKMKEDPRGGRAWMEKWTIILTIPMAALSAIGQINIFNLYLGQSVINSFALTKEAWLPTVTTVISMIAGTMIGVWLGQLISEYGLRNQGLSLIIFAGIVSRIPASLGQLFQSQDWWWLIIIVLVILVLTIFAIVFVQQGRRNVPVMFPGRRIGNRMSMPVKSQLPLMVNMAGMIPIIFAQSFLAFPAILASFFANAKAAWVKSAATWTTEAFASDKAIYPILYFILVVAFSFFYTDVLFAQQDYGENLKKQGAQIPGVTRGKPTQKYLTKVQRRITLPGALFLGLVAVMPYVFSAILKAVAPTAENLDLFLVSSAGLLIVVGTVRDTFQLIETELKLHGYEDRLIS